MPAEAGSPHLVAAMSWSVPRASERSARDCTVIGAARLLLTNEEMMAMRGSPKLPAETDSEREPHNQITMRFQSGLVRQSDRPKPLNPRLACRRVGSSHHATPSHTQPRTPSFWLLSTVTEATCTILLCKHGTHTTSHKHKVRPSYRNSPPSTLRLQTRKCVAAPRLPIMP